MVYFAAQESHEIALHISIGKTLCPGLGTPLQGNKLCEQTEKELSIIFPEKKKEERE